MPLAFQIWSSGFLVINRFVRVSSLQKSTWIRLRRSWLIVGAPEVTAICRGRILARFRFSEVNLRHIGLYRTITYEWVRLDELYKMAASVFPLGAREARNRKMAVFWIMAFWVKCAQKCLWSVRPPASDFRFGIYAKFWSRWNYWASASRCRIEEFVIWSWAKSR